MASLGTIALIVVLALSQAACGSSETPAQREQRMEDYAKQFGVDVDVKTGADGTQSVTVERNLGGTVSQAGSNLSVPAGFPEDLPLYPDLNIFTAAALPTGGHMLQGQAADAPDKVTEFYTQRMTANGWTQAGTTISPVMRMFEYRKENRTANINLLPNGTGTTVQISTMPGQ